MKRFAALISGMFTILLLVSGPSLAANDPQPTLKVEKVEAAMYRELVLTEKASMYGVRETLRPEADLLAAVRIVLVPEWTDQIKRLQVDHKEIKLSLPDGAEVTMVGYFERFGMFSLQTRSLYAYRPNNWKEKTDPVIFNAVFSVPAETREAVFKIGDTSTPVQFPSEVSPVPDPAEAVQVEIIESRLVDSIQAEYRVGELKPKPVTVITCPTGKFMEVKVKITPVRSNGDSPDNFFWYTPWFAARLETGEYVAVEGELFMDGLSNNVSHNLGRGSDGWSSGQATLYFPVPNSAAGFQLVYVFSEVGEGRVAGAPAPAPKPEPEPRTKEEKAKSAIEQFFKKKSN